MKLQSLNGKSFFVVLPKSIVLSKGWIKGDVIKVLIDSNGRLVLLKDEKKQQDSNKVK